MAPVLSIVCVFEIVHTIRNIDKSKYVWGKFARQSPRGKLAVRFKEWWMIRDLVFHACVSLGPMQGEVGAATLTQSIGRNQSLKDMK